MGESSVRGANEFDLGDVVRGLSEEVYGDLLDGIIDGTGDDPVAEE